MAYRLVELLVVKLSVFVGNHTGTRRTTRISNSLRCCWLRGSGSATSKGAGEQGQAVLCNLKEEGVVPPSPTHASKCDLQAGARGRHHGGGALSRPEKERKINTL